MKQGRKALKGRIIFVNSFKGGAGKTTLSLSHCISGLFKKGLYGESNYDNVIYMDLDILGTATCYLFGEEKKLDNKSCFECTGKPVRITLPYDGKKQDLYVAYLNPTLKNESFFGQNYFINHQTIDMENLKNQVIEFLQVSIQENPNRLIVIDCAPGFSELEQKVMEKCYHLAFEKDVEIEENYVTTLDAGHVKKSIQCLDDSLKGWVIKPEYRNICITMNDIRNFAGYFEEKEGKEFDIRNIAEKMEDELKKEGENRKINFFYWKYSSSVAVRTTYTMEQKVEKSTEDYLLTDSIYKKIELE